MYKRGHLELLTASSHFSALVHVLFFLCTVSARGCVRGVYVCVFPSNRASICTTRRPPLSNTTHPCLLSSSGSGPVELEHGAQLLSASEDFILRTKKHKTVSTSKNWTVPLSFCSVRIIFLWLHKNNDKTGHRWQFQHKALFPNINVTAPVIYLIFI